MGKLLTIGRLMFVIGMVALGFLGLVYKDFIIGRPPAWQEGLSLNPALGYITSGLVMLGGVAILFKKKPGLVTLGIAFLILLLSVSRHMPQFMNDWLNAYKAMALAGGALIVACSFFREWRFDVPGFTTEKMTIDAFSFLGCLLLALFFIAAGYAHFKFDDFVKNFIPNYIPFRSFFTYFCGICLFAGGVGILIPQTRTLAAVLSGCMIAGWFLLLHIPRFITNPNDASDRMGLCESLTFAGIFFVLASTKTITSDRKN
jgi:uncharacterized membrane protein